MNKRYAVALLAVLAAAGCGNSNNPAATSAPTSPPPSPPPPSSTPPTPALYTETNATTGNEVLAYSRASDGSLKSIGSYSTGGVGTGLPTDPNALPFPVGGATGAVKLNPAGTFLYAVDAGSNDVAAYSVATDGTLTFIDNYPTNGTSPGSITIDATGTYLYVLNTGTLAAGTDPGAPVGNTGGITGFTIGSSGALTAISGSTQPLSTGSTGAYVDPSEVAFSPDGSYLVVTEKLSGTPAPGTIDIYPVTTRSGRASGLHAFHRRDSFWVRIHAVRNPGRLECRSPRRQPPGHGHFLYGNCTGRPDRGQRQRRG